jgi:lysophospholipase L1-like esterase
LQRSGRGNENATAEYRIGPPGAKLRCAARGPVPSQQREHCIVVCRLEKEKFKPATSRDREAAMFKPARDRAPVRPVDKAMLAASCDIARHARPSIPAPGRHAASPGATASRAAIAARLVGSFALLPLAIVQGKATRRRVPSLPPAQPPYRGLVPGAGQPIRLLAIGESTVSGVGLTHGEETVAATTARALARLTGRPVAWRAEGLSGATVRDARRQLVPRIAAEPADLMLVAFGVNDATAYRSPATFADDLAELVMAVRQRVGEAAVVVGGVAPLNCFPTLPSPLRHILGWRSAALQAAADRLVERLPRLVVERIPALEPELFASDGFHPNRLAHAIWGEEIAALALPLLADREQAVALSA